MNAHLPVSQVDERSRAFGMLNAGVLYVSRVLDVTVCNDMGRNFLESAPPVGQAAPLESCLSASKEVYRTIVDLISYGHEPRDTVVMWDTDGRVRHVLIDGYMHKDAKGNLLGMHLTLKDLGNMVALEQHMLRTDKLATVGKIAAGIAHEIRNPLTTLKGFLQVFEDRFEGEKANEDLLNHTRIMQREIERVNGLVGELLLLSKPREMEKIPCLLLTLFEELNPILESEALLRDIDYQFSIEDPNLCVLADSAMLKQVILNLTKNAVEAMDAGGNLKIHVHHVDLWAQIDVSDTGPGIPYYQVDRIFDAFFTTKERGTGLGLPICQAIISNHGGEIRVSSKGFGTTFTVLLPTVSAKPRVAN